MRVYVSGKIGEGTISEKTRKKFEAATLELEKMGYEVFDPTAEMWQSHLQEKYKVDCRWEYRVVSFYDYVLLRDLMVLATCDAICLLSDWCWSPGARTELDYALATRKTVLELTGSGDVKTWISGT